MDSSPQGSRGESGASACEALAAACEREDSQAEQGLSVRIAQFPESGRRLTRSKFLAKRPHSGGHRPGKKLNNVRKNPGRTREDLRYLAIRNSRQIPAKFHENLAKFDQNFEKFL